MNTYIESMGAIGRQLLSAGSYLRLFLVTLNSSFIPFFFFDGNAKYLTLKYNNLNKYSTKLDIVTLQQH